MYTLLESGTFVRVDINIRDPMIREITRRLSISAADQPLIIATRRVNFNLDKKRLESIDVPATAVN